MRGWTHYLSGLAMSTFFTPLLEDLARGILWPVITGFYAYLPDFIDFKFRKFLWRRDVLVDPAPQDSELRVSPRRILISKLRPENRWQFYYIEGVVKAVTTHSEELTEFVVEDDSGEIRVVAKYEDCQRLKEIIGDELSVGMRVRVPGYMDVDAEGNPYWNVADAPHPNYIAGLVAKAIDLAYETGKRVTVKIYNIRMPGDVYRRFLIHYDSSNKKIRVLMGPLVSTGGLPVENTGVPYYRALGEASTKHPFKKVYPRPTIIDAFSGPEIGFVKNSEEGVVEEEFIPWHRGFTHSFTAGFIFSIFLIPILLFLGYGNYLYLTLAAMLGYWMHVIEDQMGMMGSVLLPPITKKRVPGLMIGPRMPAAMNFATNWAMISLIMWNLNRSLPSISPGFPKIIDLTKFTGSLVPDVVADLALLVILLTPTILIYVFGVIDRAKFIKLLKEQIREKELEELIDEMEEVGGF
ncbi:MAG: metal-dependent hydrolase [Zestosphaera sp.]